MIVDVCIRDIAVCTSPQFVISAWLTEIARQAHQAGAYGTASYIYNHLSRQPTASGSLAWCRQAEARRILHSPQLNLTGSGCNRADDFMATFMSGARSVIERAARAQTEQFRVIHGCSQWAELSTAWSQAGLERILKDWHVAQLIAKHTSNLISRYFASHHHSRPGLQYWCDAGARAAEGLLMADG